MEQKRLFDLEIGHLQKQVVIDIGWEQTESGLLTDFYGSADEDNKAVIAVELDDNLTFFLPPNSKIYLKD